MTELSKATPHRRCDSRGTTHLSSLPLNDRASLWATTSVCARNETPMFSLASFPLAPTDASVQGEGQVVEPSRVLLVSIHSKS